MTLDGILDKIGFIFSLSSLFKQIREYIKKSRETGGVRERLLCALQSIHKLEAALNKTHNLGKEFVHYFKQTPLPLPETELLRKLTEIFDALHQLLASLRSFASECKELVQNKAFMDSVKKTKGDVHDIIEFFARAYNTKEDSLDLNGLPMLLRLYGDKVLWKENKIKGQIM